MKRLTCIQLALCLLIPMFGSVSFAEESENLSTEATNDRQYTLDDLAAGFITPYECFGELNPSTVPEIIGYETALSRFHVQRMYEEEDDLNTVVFMNTDLSRTKYYKPFVTYIEFEHEFSGTVS